jgi:uncharacterized protein with PQ loop repeat
MLRMTEVAGFLGVGLAAAAYLPQIRHLLKEQCSAGISRFAFNAWLLASLLVLMRAVAIRAGVFILLGAVQVVATAVICVAAKVYEHSYCGSHLPTDQLATLS